MRKTVEHFIFYLLTLELLLIQFNDYAIAKESNNSGKTFWSIQAIDTMKYSRDTARGEATSKEFEAEIATQVKNIADIGATHIAIGTPYDEEFVPFMNKWIKEARKNNLSVWFRGNWAGWEEWFEYPSIDRKQHLEKTQQFILSHPDLFEDGDIFSPCPECENGGPGDPRFMTGDDDLEKYQEFLKDLQNTSASAFKEINKNVRSGYFSMNGDVANLVMDSKTTNALGNVVVVDHYVDSPTQLNDDISKYAKNSEANVILGEFGAPIPDIHGEMTETEQAEWLDESLALLSNNANLIGLNYWTAVGGSTEIFRDGKPTPAAQVLQKYFKPKVAEIQILNELGEPLEQATIKHKTSRFKPGKDAKMNILYTEQPPTVMVTAQGYEEAIVQVADQGLIQIVLIKNDPGFVFLLRKYLFNWGML
jgi:hypothetical protein